MMSAAAVAVMNSQLLEPFNYASRFRTLGEHLDDESLNGRIGEAQVCGDTGSRGGAAIEPIGTERASQFRTPKKTSTSTGLMRTHFEPKPCAPRKLE